MQRFGDMAAPKDDENETSRNPLSPAERLLFASLRGWAGLRAAAGPSGPPGRPPIRRGRAPAADWDRAYASLEPFPI